MLGYLLIFAASCLLVLIYSQWITRRRYWKDLGVPHLPPYPIIGSMTFLLRQNPGIWMKNMYEQFKTPYVGIWLFWRPALVINCPELARNVLVKDSANFRNKFISSGNSDPVGAYNIMLSKDPIWTSLRKHFTPVFTTSKLKYVHTIAKTKSNEFTRRVAKEIENGHADIRMMMTDYTTDVFGISAFGVTSNATLTGKGALRKITKEFMEFDIFRGLSWCSIFFFPELVDIFRFTFTPKSTTQYFKKVFRDILLQHEETKNVTDPKTLLDALVQLKSEDFVDKDVDIENFIVAQAAIFLIAGFDTTGSTLTLASYTLAFHPEEQEIIYKELIQAKEKHGNDFLSFNGLQELQRLDCVVKEILRLSPPMGWLDRIALNDYKVDDNLTIKAGTPVYINANGLHIDPEFFPEPNKFDPTRFLPGNESKIKPFTYLPFGDGPRKCIGFRFAQVAIKCALAALILNYKLEPLPGFPRPEDVEIENKNLLLFPGETLKVKMVRRKENGDQLLDI